MVAHALRYIVGLISLIGLEYIFGDGAMAGLVLRLALESETQS